MHFRPVEVHHLRSKVDFRPVSEGFRLEKKVLRPGKAHNDREKFDFLPEKIEFRDALWSIGPPQTA